MADAREVMNIRQASQYLGVSPDTLYKYVSEEKIPAFKLGNRWKFKKSLLDTWMENQSLNTDVGRPRSPIVTRRACNGPAERGLLCRACGSSHGRLSWPQGATGE